MSKLYTAGYGNRPFEEFFTKLPEGCILVDVRRSQYGRCRLFYGNNLALHFGERYLPHQYDGTGTLGNDYYLGTANRWVYCVFTAKVEAALDAVARLVREGQTVVLMCCELDANRCHRRLVAEEIARRVPGTEIVNL